MNFTVILLNFSRGDKPPSKELLRLFIRTYAIRAGQTPTSPWIVDDNQVRKLDLQSKFANFLLSPVRVSIKLSDGLGGSVGCAVRLETRAQPLPRSATFFHGDFVEIDREIFSTVILSLPLIQEGQLSVSGERMCTTLVNPLEN